MTESHVICGTLEHKTVTAMFSSWQLLRVPRSSSLGKPTRAGLPQCDICKGSSRLCLVWTQDLSVCSVLLHHSRWEPTWESVHGGLSYVPPRYFTQASPPALLFIALLFLCSSCEGCWLVLASLPAAEPSAQASLIFTCLVRTSIWSSALFRLPPKRLSPEALLLSCYATLTPRQYLLLVRHYTVSLKIVYTLPYFLLRS